MALSWSTNYVLPAVLLNPILFLHSLNAILSRLLPPITVDAATQPVPYYPLGPSAEHPHIDMHAHDNLCWSYTCVMVCAQLVVFGRVNRMRNKRREKATNSEEVVSVTHTQTSKEVQAPKPNATHATEEGVRLITSQGPLPLERSCRDPVCLSGVNGHVITPIDRVEWGLVH